MEYTHRSTRYRLLPRTRAKHQKLMQVTGACVWVWNRVLSDVDNAHERDRRMKMLRGEPVVMPESVRIHPTFFTLGKRFTAMRKDVGWLRDLPFAAVRHTLRHQADAWTKFFKRQGGHPSYKSKYRTRTVTFPEPGHFQLSGNSIRLQKLGWFHLARKGEDPHRHYEARAVTIKRECGRWHAVIRYKVPAHEVERIDDGRAVGVDMNVAQVATSDGEIIRLDRERLERLECRKHRYQRRMARQAVGSNRRNVTKQRLSKVCRNIRCCRDNWQHHTSKRVAAKAGTVMVEKLNTKGMTASAKGAIDEPGTNVSQKEKAGLNKAILNTGWGGLKQKLSYKSARLVEVNPQHTSQTCSRCGFIDKNNRPTQAMFKCLACGHTDNADVNAALNILASWIGATGRGGGDIGRPVKRQEVAEGSRSL